MSNEVDTDRPEYSWIPFFEELARRLAAPDISESEGSALVELLVKMEEHGAPVPPSILEHRQSVLDPFTFLSMLNYTNITDENFESLCHYLKETLQIHANVPSNDFYRPHLPPITLLRFFDRTIDSSNEIKKHWELFQFISNYSGDRVPTSDDQLIELIGRSVSVKFVGISKLSMALYWINPYAFLHVNTINGILELTGSELVKSSDPFVAETYCTKLSEVKMIDSRQGPIVNDLVYLNEWQPPCPSVALGGDGEIRVWVVRSRGRDITDLVVKNGYIGLGWDDADLEGCENREDVRKALRAGKTQTNERRIGQEAGSILRFLREMNTGDLVITPTDDGGVECGTVLGEPTFKNNDGLPFATRRPVEWKANGPFDRGFLPSTVWNRQQTVNELKGNEASTALAHYGEITDGEPRVWSVKSNGGTNASTVVNDGYSGVGWAFPGLSECRNFGDIKDQFPIDDPDYPPARVRNEAGSLSRFLFDIKIGDYALTSTADGRFYYGVVTGAVTFGNDDGSHYATRRTVDWRIEDVRRKDELPANVWKPLQTVTELKDGNRDAFLSLIDEPSPEIPTRDPYTIGTMLDEGVFLDEPELRRIVAQLERKQNLILQGPPGTGKTFLAKRLAYALMGERADERIASVQFHQSYSYEDFVGGYRPGVNDDQQLVFESRDGAFLRLCQRARAVPDDRFVMLIDEINRGNLSRVFGELLMLIEADKRSSAHAIELQHRIADQGDPDGKFFVPPNVYIIGTMNLADRSLTGMNVAMRRRFAFAELRPRFDNERFATEVRKAGMADEMLERIKGRMTALNEVIEGDASLGRQYEVGHSFFCPDSDGPPGGDWEAWYEAVVEFEIRPLLEEYWFDDARKAADEVAKLKGEGTG